MLAPGRSGEGTEVPRSEVLLHEDGVTYSLVKDLGGDAEGMRLLLARRTRGTTDELRLLKCLSLPEGAPPSPEEVRARRRLEESVLRAACLRRPAIARVYGLHAVPGAPYVELEYVRGLSLDAAGPVRGGAEPHRLRGSPTPDELSTGP